MLVCPVCGFRNPHSNERCLKCSALLQRNEVIIDRAMYEGAEKARKQYYRDLVAAPLERLGRLVSLPSWRPKSDLPYKFPFTAGGLSILPGLGQMYNHQFAKGLTLAIIWAATLVLCIFTITQPYSNFLFLLLVVGWMLIWNDAVGTAIRSNGQSWSLRHSLAMLCGAMALIGISLTAAQFFGLGIVSLVRVRVDVHRPLIREWDRVYVNHVRYWFFSPRFGEIVWFDPPRITAEAGANVYSIDIKSYFQRVIGVAGDHLEKKNGIFLRNGSVMPAEELPIGAETMPEFSVMVPSGHVFAPVTLIPQDSLSNTIGSLIAPDMALFRYVGEPGFAWMNWPDVLMVPMSEVYGKAVAVVDPPEHRRWLL